MLAWTVGVLFTIGSVVVVVVEVEVGVGSGALGVLTEATGVESVTVVGVVVGVGSVAVEEATG